MSSADINKLVSRFARQVRRARALEAAGLAGVMAGTLAIMALLIAWRYNISSLQRLEMLGVSVGGAMALAWLIRTLHPLRKARAAALIDSRYHLHQQLITAEELLRRETSGPWDDLIFSRALEAAQTIGAQPNVWKQTRRLPAALGLVVLAGLIIAFLPVRENPVAQTAAERMTALSQARREAIADELQQVRTDISPAERQRLEDIAKAIQANDPEAFKELIEKAEKQAPDWKNILSENVQTDLGFRDPPKTEGYLSNPPLSQDVKPEAEMGTVSVYNPAYGNLTREPDAASRKMEPRQIAYDDAWRAARDEARKNLTHKSLPREYRQIVRRFYDLNAAGQK